MPRITLAKTPREYFDYFRMNYMAHHEDAREIEVWSAFVDMYRNISLEDVRGLMRELAFEARARIQELTQICNESMQVWSE